MNRFSCCPQSTKPMMNYCKLQKNKGHWWQHWDKDWNMVVTCVTPRLITKESNWRVNERKEEAQENVIRLIDEKRIQNGLFTAKEDGRRQNCMVSDKHRTCPVAQYLKKKKTLLAAVSNNQHSIPATASHFKQNLLILPLKRKQSAQQLRDLQHAVRHNMSYCCLISTLTHSLTENTAHS